VLIAAAVCPHPPLLVPELASGAAAELDDLRAACDAAVASVVAAKPDLVVVVGGAAEDAEFDGSAAGSLADYGVAWRTGEGVPVLPLSLTIGRWLLVRRGLLEEGEPLSPRRAGPAAEQRPGEPAEQRPGEQAEHRPGEQAEHRPGEPAEHRPGEPTEQRPGEQAEQALEQPRKPLTGPHGLAGTAVEGAPSAPVTSAVAARAGAAAGNPSRVRLRATAFQSPVQACLRLGAEIAGRARRVAILAMGDGSARRSTRAPGYLDTRAEPYDAAVASALAVADAGWLARIDPGLSDELMAAGRAAWQVLAGAAGDGRYRARLHRATAPYGVGYFVASWRALTEP
jgi:hypothetical protein